MLFSVPFFILPIAAPGSVLVDGRVARYVHVLWSWSEGMLSHKKEGKMGVLIPSPHHLRQIKSVHPTLSYQRRCNNNKATFCHISHKAPSTSRSGSGVIVVFAFVELSRAAAHPVVQYDVILCPCEINIHIRMQRCIHDPGIAIHDGVLVVDVRLVRVVEASMLLLLLIVG